MCAIAHNGRIRVNKTCDLELSHRSFIVSACERLGPRACEKLVPVGRNDPSLIFEQFISST